MKPHNILFHNYTRTYLVADFGATRLVKQEIAKQNRRKKEIKTHALEIQNKDELGLTIKGSPGYWAPEIFYLCGIKTDKNGDLDL